MTFWAGLFLGMIIGAVIIIDLACIAVSGKESKNEDRQRDANRGIYNK